MHILFFAIIFIKTEQSISLINKTCSHLPNMTAKGSRLVMYCCPTIPWFSIKWYMENFAEETVGQGNEIDSKNSVQGRLVLKNVSSSCMYRCDVTGPPPDYHTDTIFTYVKAVKLPEKPPVIEIVGKSLYCTIQIEDPKYIEVTWLIDGYTAPPSWVDNQSILTIKKKIESQLEVKCVTRIGHIYWAQDSVLVGKKADE